MTPTRWCEHIDHPIFLTKITILLLSYAPQYCTHYPRKLTTSLGNSSKYNTRRFWPQDAAETREAFSALKSQFIAHHDMLDSKERDLVRKDLKVC